MSNKKTVAVHVWRDDPSAAERGCDEYYSVSEVDSDDEEVRCDRGSKSLEKAWKMGCELADDLGVECVAFAGPASTQGQATDRYVPKSSEVQS